MSDLSLERRGIWRTYSTVEGLTDLQVEHIVEDQDGYLWFATWNNGVCRFDGDEFYALSQKDGLSSNRVLALHIDRNGYLWLGTAKGVCRYDGEVIRPVAEIPAQYIEFIYEDREGRLWFGGVDLLGYFDGKTYHSLKPLYMQQFGADQTEAWPRRCWGITQDLAGDIWIGCDSLMRYDGHALQRYGAEEGLDVELPATSFTVACGLDGDLWIGRNGHIWRYNGSKFQPMFQREKSTIRKIQLDKDGRIWFATMRGVLYYDGEQFADFTTRDGLPYDLVNGVLHDREGLFWFATWGGGVCCYDPFTSRIFAEQLNRSHSYYCTFKEDRRGHIWFGFRTQVPISFPKQDAIACYDGQHITLREPSEYSRLGNCLAIFEDLQGDLWFGMADGIIRYDGHRWQKASLGEGFSGEAVSAIAGDAEGNMYLGHTSAKGEKVQLTRWDGQTCQTLFELPNNQFTCINAIIASDDGTIWFSIGSWSDLDAGKGIGRWHEQTGVVLYTVADGLVDDRVEDLCLDRHQVLWIATQGGVSCFDGSQFRNFTTEDGLPNNHIRSVFEDRQGTLFFASDGGVIRYDGEVFQTVRSPHIGPTYRVFEDARGYYWFATISGIVRYRPSLAPPSVQITNIIADQVYQGMKKVEIPTSVRQLIVEYKGIGFRTHPRDMLYTYRLCGYEDEWSRATHGMRTHYKDLPPGEYAFEVKAIDRDMNFSEVVALDVVIVPDPHIEALTAALGDSAKEEGFIGKSAVLHLVKTQLKEVAATDLSVLISGATGTGKGLAARLLHRMSPRGTEPFIQINCGAIPESLLESELFGHERGAFTGAIARKIGKAELAGGGTLFLDEVADLALTSQVKLLHLLEERTFARVGGNAPLKCNARVVSATNRDLRHMVDAGEFRADLYFRLQVFSIHLPSLCQRQEDISLLAFYFLEKMARHLHKPVYRLTPEALEQLMDYPWPGNVRELEHVIQRAVIVSPGTEIRAQDLALGQALAGVEMPEESPVANALADELPTLAEYEKSYIMRVIEKTGGTISGPRGAAAILGLHESTLRNRMKKLGIAK